MNDGHDNNPAPFSSDNLAEQDSTQDLIEGMFLIPSLPFIPPPFFPSTPLKNRAP